MLSQHKGPRGDPYRLRRNNFVGQRILDNTILVDSRFVRKGICANHRFIGRHDSSGDFRKHAARGEELFETDSRGDSEAFLRLSHTATPSSHPPIPTPSSAS